MKAEALWIIHYGGPVYNVGEADALSELEWAQLVVERMEYTGGLIVLGDERCPPHLVPPPGNLSSTESRIRHASETSWVYAERGSRIEALGQTVAWQRGHVPPVIDTSAFNYAAEDAALLRLVT
jgi:hypothetical protein